MLVDDKMFHDVIKDLRDRHTLCVDLETNSLDPNTGKIAGVAVAYKYGENCYQTYYFPYGHGEGSNLDPDTLITLWDAIYRAEALLFWNATFDLQFMLKAPTPFPYPRKAAKVFDGMIALHLLNENEPNYRLKDAGVRYIGTDADAEQQELKQALHDLNLGTGDMWQLPAALVAPYAEQDVRLTYQLIDFFEPHLKTHEGNDDLYRIWQESSDYVLTVLDITRRGILLDHVLLKQNEEYSTRAMEEAVNKLEEATGIRINPNSPKQVRAAFNLPNAQAATIEAAALHGGQPGLLHMISYKRHSKMRGSYYRRLIEEAEILPDGGMIIHPNLHMTGTISSRFACSKPNLQAIPRKTSDPNDPRNYVKAVFRARPGFRFLQIDYKQAEVYLGAHYAQCAALIDMIHRGVDIHGETAKEVGIERDIAKRMNFSMMYGIGADELAKTLTEEIKRRVTVRDAVDFITRYNRRFPEMSQLAISVEAFAKEHEFIRLWTGRIRHYHNSRHRDYHRASSNLIQGGVAEIMRITMSALWRKWHDTDLFYMLMQVHDSIMAEVKEGAEGFVVPNVAHTMTNLQPYFPFRVPFRVDAEIGDTWYNLKPYNPKVYTCQFCGGVAGIQADDELSNMGGNFVALYCPDCNTSTVHKEER